MATKQAKRKKTKERGHMLSRAFAAYPEEFALWQNKADAEDRSFSQWVRLRLLKADVADEGLIETPNELQKG